jgi:hypothetical protein
MSDDKKKIHHASTEQKHYCLEFGTRILLHKTQKIYHEVCTIETTITLICYYEKLYLHEYIHTHTQIDTCRLSQSHAHDMHQNVVHHKREDNATPQQPSSQFKNIFAFGVCPT